MLLVFPALWLVRGGLGTGRFAGLALGEVWGRLFVWEQVARWSHGTPVGEADLLSLGQGQSFWPTEPLTVLLGLLLRAGFGEPTAWALVLAVLALTSGVAAMAVARRAGASPLGALVVGLLVQWCPYWLRVSADGVTEALALGPPLFALWAGGRLWQRADATGWALAALAGVLVAGTSPYYAVYGFGTALLTAPWWGRRQPRRTLALLGLWLACGLAFAVPLYLAESGDGGRMSARWVGGYRLLPDRLVSVDGAGALGKAPPLAARFVEGARHASWQRWLVVWPGGLAVTAALVAGLFARLRPVAALGLGVLLLGPGWAVLLPGGPPPLVRATSWLPGLDLLANPERWTAVPVLAAALAVSPLLTGRLRPLLLLLLVIFAARMEVPPLSLPSAEARVGALPGLPSGGVVTFPDGDPPIWNREAWPKESLWRAAHHGQPVPYDYGRTGARADVALQARLAQLASVALGEQAARRWTDDDRRLAQEAREAGLRTVLIVERELDENQRAALERWLSGWAGEPLAREAGFSAWEIPPHAEGG